MIYPSKTFGAASLLLLCSMAVFMVSFQQHTLSTMAWFGRDLNHHAFKSDEHGHEDDHGHDDPNDGAVAAAEELEVWEADWHGPYEHGEDEWRVFFIPMTGNVCSCYTWADSRVDTDTDLFMTDNPDYVLNANWAGWDAVAEENGARETGTIRNTVDETWNCYAAVYGVVDTSRAGIICYDSANSRIEAAAAPEWAA